MTSLTLGTNAILYVDQPYVMTNDIMVLGGGKMTHTANSTSEVYKLNLTLRGNLTILTNGSINVDAKGLSSGGPTAGGSYGGLGWSTSSLPTYGSIIAPTNMGLRGYSTAGGGAILLAVTGTITNNGAISANSASIDYATGSGGSINIVAGALAGSGNIQANAGTASVNTPRYGSGGGGRIALVVTNSGADFTNFTGLIAAYGGGAPTPAGAGTIYKQTAAQRPGRGTVLLDNNNNNNNSHTNAFTDVPPRYYPIDEARRASFYLTNGANLRLTNAFTVGDIWLQKTNTTLDLGSNTLNVKTVRHDLTNGVVTNYGQVMWLQQGTIFCGY